MCMSIRGPIYRIYKQLLYINKEKGDNPIEKWAKHLYRKFLK